MRKKKPAGGDYDVIVIGAGPGGYVAAIRCAQLGLKTACVDEWLDHDGKSSLGGTCLNVGCIPSKALLESSLHYYRAHSEFEAHGIRTGKLRLDLDAMQARKNKVVADLTAGIGVLFKTNGVDVYHGRGKVRAGDRAGRYQVSVKSRKDRKLLASLQAANIIIATGSSPIRLPQAPLRDGMILDSAAALEMTTLPKTLGIIGAGAIGLEIGSIWARLGAKVTLFEAMPELLPQADELIAREAGRILRQQGLNIRTGCRVLATEVSRGKVRLTLEQGGEEETLRLDRLVVAVGRKPNSERVFGKELAVETDERSFILVDEHGETCVPGIYAIGDVVGGPMLAHKASEEGVRVAERIAGGRNGNGAQALASVIPSVIYTHPEIAWAGKTEAQCRNEGLNFRSGRFPLAANGRAHAAGDAQGVVKIIADAASDRILGVHMVAAQASELIAQAVLAMEMQATAEDLAMTVFAHPSLSESLHEAALAVNGQAIHIKN